MRNKMYYWENSENVKIFLQNREIFVNYTTHLFFMPLIYAEIVTQHFNNALLHEYFVYV